MFESWGMIFDVAGNGKGNRKRSRQVAYLLAQKERRTKGVDKSGIFLRKKGSNNEADMWRDSLP